MVNQLAAAGTSLNAGVAYYGAQIPAADVPKISAPLLLHYAALDERINAGIPDYEAALKANNKTLRDVHVRRREPRLQQRHERGSATTRQAADLAWGRTIRFLKKHLA